MRTGFARLASDSQLEGYTWVAKASFTTGYFKEDSYLSCFQTEFLSGLFFLSSEEQLEELAAEDTSFEASTSTNMAQVQELTEDYKRAASESVVRPATGQEAKVSF